MNKRMLYFFTLVVFIFSFKNEKRDLENKPSIELNEDCRISKIYLNLEVYDEFHYDEKNRLVKVEYYQRFGHAYYFSTSEYDKLGRLVFSNMYFTNAGKRILKPDSSNYIQDRFMAEFKYKESSMLIDEVKYYTGNFANSELQVEDGHLNYVQKVKYFYDDNKKLAKIILGKKKRKSSKIIITSDETHNPILIDFYENKKNGRLYKSIERKYDSSPIISFRHSGFPSFLYSKNNVIYEKITRFQLNDSNMKNKIEEKKIEYIYNEKGLISEYLVLGRDSLMNFYDYEYVCD